MSLRGLLIALQFLTWLPVPRLSASRPGDLASAAPFFPVVGAVIGAAVAGAVTYGGYVSPLVGALAGLLAWVAITGGLHLDGLGDVADALGAAHGNRERFIEVLRDPHAGSFAVIVIALQIATKLTLLASLPMTAAAAFAGLVLIPAWARWAALVWGAALRPLKSGLGQSFASNLSVSVIVVWGIALAGLSAWLAPALLVALAVAALIGVYWHRRLGGITGDCLGAGIEVMESLLLLALVIVSAP